MEKPFARRREEKTDQQAKHSHRWTATVQFHHSLISHAATDLSFFNILSAPILDGQIVIVLRW